MGSPAIPWPLGRPAGVMLHSHENAVAARTACGEQVNVRRMAA